MHEKTLDKLRADIIIAKQILSDYQHSPEYDTNLRPLTICIDRLIKAVERLANQE